ncbi:SDR family oxidoreductase [Acinetobacter soli]|uniref:SDR family oxidoreductase n=1 Tax=Acinetobacter soli TaxID=487316 RepID=UPI0025838641|nr:SDR family oxidoreductase [uncultured Acinetobacter sp.]
MNKTVFITGAGQGIGAEIARIFYQHGYYVGLFDVQVEQVKALQRELGERAFAGYLDVCDYSAWQIALANFETWAGALNILVNNAGVLYSGPFEDTPIAHHQRTHQINVGGVLNGCHAALPYLQKAHHARVINLSSASAIYGQADLASYSASKFAVRGLTEALDVEWSKYKIRVLDVMPLFVQTAMVEQMNAASIEHMGVQLSAQDVACEVFRLAQATDRGLCPTHTPVGFKAKIMFQLSKLSPQVLNRLSNLWLSRRD